MSDLLGAVAELLGETTVPQATTYVDKPTVLAVQSALKAKGFDPGPIDGVFGPKTAAAIKKMQASVSIPTTGVIDYGVLSTLRVQAPASAPTRTEAGTSASAAAQDVAKVANNAAGEATKADTSTKVQEIAQVVQAAATAAPPAPPAVQAEVKKAVEQAKAAKTPEEVKVAAKARQMGFLAVVTGDQVLSPANGNGNLTQTVPLGLSSA